MAEKRIRTCSLYPFDLLFEHAKLNQHPHFDFVKTNYPLAIFHNNLNQAFALVQINSEKKILDISSIGDPREFWGASSTQFHDALGLFTLIELNQQQRNECFCFDKKSSWGSLVNSIQLDLFEHPFSTHIQPQFKLIHNLYYYDLQDDSLPLLLENHQASPQVGLSLLVMLNSIEAAIKNLKHVKNENSPIYLFTTEEYAQLLDYEYKLSEHHVYITCYTANHFNQENLINDEEKVLLKQLQKKYPKANYFNATSDQGLSATSTSTDKVPEKPWVAFFSLVLIFTMLFALLYGFYLLFKQFEFIKFAAITIGIIVFLAIWSKK
ncbi:hypothetical protein M5F00_07090 [Acinetobacter sp. ANC 4945]|nr:hypothetical protein [Acinetobacter amyesii]